jgi:two-component system, chemotaxis family, response regulator Rcp1
MGRRDIEWFNGLHRLGIQPAAEQQGQSATTECLCDFAAKKCQRGSSLLTVMPLLLVSLLGDKLSMLLDTIQGPGMFAQESLTRHILLIEDNPADANLMQIVHDDKIPWSSLDIVSSGSEAIHRLCGEGNSPAPNIPDVIFLDMFLPMTSGLELIADIRALPGCEVVPIVMISGTENPIFLRRAYQLGANCVIKKPNTLEEYFRKLARCLEFWCRIAELPHPMSGRSAHC